MKLDVNALRYLAKEDFRTLQAVEMGQRNHELVPLALIDSIAGLKYGGTVRALKELLRHKLLHHEGGTAEGYRLTWLGYDFLALRALVGRGAVAAVGRQIGVGKESDVYEVVDDEGRPAALKLHRLGRTSFRAVKAKRDYLGRRSAYSWLYLSRLAARREHGLMAALHAAGFPVPQALDQSRHAVLMSLVPGVPLSQVDSLENPARVYEEAMALMARLARSGLVHCDFNEFNLLVSPDSEALTLIDFPQMVPVTHPNAAALFDRDATTLDAYFARRLDYHPPEGIVARLTFEEAVGEGGAAQLPGIDLGHKDTTNHDRWVLKEQGFGGDSASEAGSTDSAADRADIALERPRSTAPSSEARESPAQAGVEHVLRGQSKGLRPRGDAQEENADEASSEGEATGQRDGGEVREELEELSLGQEEAGGRRQQSGGDGQRRETQRRGQEHREQQKGDARRSVQAKVAQQAKNDRRRATRARAAKSTLKAATKQARRQALADATM